MERDAWHKELVDSAGVSFCPYIVVDNIGVWTPSSIEILRSIARSSTVHNGLPTGKVFHYLVE